MDPLRTRIADLTAGRRWLPAAVAAVAVLVLAGAIVLAAGSATGTTAALPVPTLRTAPAAAPTPLLVHVSGAVRRAGLVSVPSGARVVDAIAAAGGPTVKADQAAVNLAARVADGQQVVVPERGAGPPATGAASGPTGSGAGYGSGAPVSIGSGTAQQLETLPHIGPALAARIIAYREAHGGFRSVDELGQVGGIGPKTLADLRDLVTP